MGVPRTKAKDKMVLVSIVAAKHMALGHKGRCTPCS